MTIRELASHLHRLSVAGYFNHEKFTLKQLYGYLDTMLRRAGYSKLVMEIALMDGWWLFEIWNPDGRRDGYLYRIPDTREQEKQIWDQLIHRYEKKEVVK